VIFVTLEERRTGTVSGRLLIVERNLFSRRDQGHQEICRRAAQDWRSGEALTRMIDEDGGLCQLTASARSCVSSPTAIAVIDLRSPAVPRLMVRANDGPIDGVEEVRPLAAMDKDLRKMEIAERATYAISFCDEWWSQALR
jgi:hypothetical protein